MTKAKITRKEGYKCAPLGYEVEVFPYGDIVTGTIAKWAIADRAASAMFDPRSEAKVTGPDEVKGAPKKRGRTRKKAAE